MSYTRIPQDRETAVRRAHADGMEWRYAYARARDQQSQGERGQDYLVVAVRDDVLAFALCDGVSQSFFGDLASVALGDDLVAWLLDEVAHDMDKSELSQRLETRLQRLCEPVSAIVAAHRLPSHVPAMLAQVLEDKRAQGSESMFVCGRVELPRDAADEGRVVVAWMGDSRWRVWNETSERAAAAEETFRTEQRWSSRRGLVAGKPNLFVSPVRRNGKRWTSRLLAYSDGLACLDPTDCSLADRDLQALIDDCALSPTSDDISYLEIALS